MSKCNYNDPLDVLVNEIEQGFMQQGGWKVCRCLLGKLVRCSIDGGVADVAAAAVRYVFAIRDAERSLQLKGKGAMEALLRRRDACADLCSAVDDLVKLGKGKNGTCRVQTKG